MRRAADERKNSRDHILRLAAVQFDYVPNIRTTVGRHWLPKEPLIEWHTRESYADSVESLRFDGPLYDETLRLVVEAERERHRALKLKLKQVLDFLVANKVDVAVFPEASVPVDLAHALLGFAASSPFLPVSDMCTLVT